MMNLLPAGQKRDIRAGRANVLLARYSILTLVALIMLVVVMAIAWLLLNNIRQAAQAEIDASDQSSLLLAKDVQAVKEFKSNLAVAKQILDQEVDYSAIILRYASVIPGAASSIISISILPLSEHRVRSAQKLEVQTMLWH